MRFNNIIQTKIITPPKALIKIFSNSGIWTDPKKHKDKIHIKCVCSHFCRVRSGKHQENIHFTSNCSIRKGKLHDVCMGYYGEDDTKQICIICCFKKNFAH